MNSFIYKLAVEAVQYGMLGMLITLAPALLLTLGLKRTGPVTMICSAGLLFSLGTFILGLTVQGFFTGEVFALSRGQLMVSLSDEPTFFWISASFFTVLGMAAYCLAALLLFQAAKLANLSFRRMPKGAA